MDSAIILLIMLSLQPAGRSYYSQTVVEPDAPPACDNVNNLLCRAPKPNPEWDGKYTRPETEEEGRERYAMIAKVVDRVAHRMTWKKHPRCQPSSIARWNKNKAPKECQRAWHKRPWQGTPKQLKKYLLTVYFHESGFRRDIHAGKGKAAKGDLDKQGRGQSWGLGQRKLGASGNVKTIRGWRARHLVGLDEESTERMTMTTVDVLSRGFNACRSGLLSSTRGPICVFGVYGGIWAAAGDRRILTRVRTYNKIAELEKLHARNRAAEDATRARDLQARRDAPDAGAGWRRGLRLRGGPTRWTPQGAVAARRAPLR